MGGLLHQYKANLRPICPSAVGLRSFTTIACVIFHENSDSNSLLKLSYGKLSSRLAKLNTYSYPGAVVWQTALVYAALSIYSQRSEYVKAARVLSRKDIESRSFAHQSP